MKPLKWVHVVLNSTRIKSVLDQYERRYGSLGIKDMQRGEKTLSIREPALDLALNIKIIAMDKDNLRGQRFHKCLVDDEVGLDSEGWSLLAVGKEEYDE